MKTLKCISPIDGSVVAERPVLSLEAARDAVARAAEAQKAWREKPLSERIALVLKGVENVGAINDEIVPELARQMGRPLADPMKLIVPMLERFIATDREFAKARRHEIAK